MGHSLTKFCECPANFTLRLGHDGWTSQEQILNYLLQGAVSQKIMSSQVCKISYQKEELKKHRYGE